MRKYSKLQGGYCTERPYPWRTGYAFWAVGSLYSFDLRPEIQDRHGGYRIYRVYVSTGVGTSGIPVRFFARPEIVVFELVKEK